jgi:hypothetical protein
VRFPLQFVPSIRQAFQRVLWLQCFVLALCSDDDEQPLLMPAAAGAPPGSDAAAAAAGPNGLQHQEPPGASPGAAVDFGSDPESPMVQLPSPSRQRAAAWEDSAAAGGAGCPRAMEAESPQRQPVHGSDVQQAAAALDAAGETLGHQQLAEQQPWAPVAHAGGSVLTSQVITW